MKEKEIKIETVKIKIKDKEIQLTLNELRELKYEIDKLLDKKVDHEPFIPWPTEPIEPEKQWWYWIYDGTDVTTKYGDGGTGGFTINKGIGG